MARRARVKRVANTDVGGIYTKVGEAENAIRTVNPTEVCPWQPSAVTYDH